MKVNVIIVAISIGLSACHPKENDKIAITQENIEESVLNNGSNALQSPPEFIKYDSADNVIPNSAAAFVSYNDLIVSNKLNFIDKLKVHAEILDRIGQAQLQAMANLNAAAATKNSRDYRDAEEDVDNVKKVLLPYALAQAQAEKLIGVGYKLSDFSGNVCRGGECRKIDPMTALFFFTGRRDGLNQDLADEASAASQPNDPGVDIQVNGFSLTALFHFLSDKPLDAATFGILPALRVEIEKPLDPYQYGEFTSLINNPDERPLEIVKGVRDHLISPGDHSDRAIITRDPVKCGAGKLFYKC